MSDLLVQDETGTKIRLDADREFERSPGDAVMRMQGQSSDGSYAFDQTYVEMDAVEADLIGTLLHEFQHPSPRTLERIAKEVQAVLPASINGRDAAQIAQIATKSWWEGVQKESGIGDEPETQRQMSKLSERFQRTAAKRREPASGNGQRSQQSRAQASASR